MSEVYQAETTDGSRQKNVGWPCRERTEIGLRKAQVRAVCINTRREPDATTDISRSNTEYTSHESERARYKVYSKWRHIDPSSSSSHWRCSGNQSKMPSSAVTKLSSLELPHEQTASTRRITPLYIHGVSYYNKGFLRLYVYGNISNDGTILFGRSNLSISMDHSLRFILHCDLPTPNTTLTVGETASEL